MSTNLVGDTNKKRADAQRPPLPRIKADFNAPVDAPPLDNPAVPPSPLHQPELDPASAFDPFAPVDVSGLQSGTPPLVQTAGQTPLQVQEQIVAPLEEAGIADLAQSEASRIEESAQEQDISILDYSPPDIDGQIQQGNERINSLIQQLDLQDKQRAAEAQDRYKGVSLQDAMQQLSREPEEGTLQRVFKQAGDYFGGAVFTDPRDGRQYTTPYVALTQRALGLPETQKEGPPNIVGGLLYGLNVVGAAPVAYAKDKLDQVNRTVHDVTQFMPWLKGTQDAVTRWMQRNAPALAAQALKKRDESLRNTAPGGSSHMTTVLRGGNYSFTQEASTGSIGKIPGTSIDVDPGSLVGFAADVATGELVERGISAIVKQGAPALARTAVRGVTLPALGSRASARRPVVPKQRALAGKPPAVKAATVPDHRAVVLRPSGRGTGKAVVPTNPDRPVTVRTIQAVPDPVVPTRAHRSAPPPKYNQPKPTGAGGQFELPLTGVAQVPIVPSLLAEPGVTPVLVNSEQLVLPGVLPERKQFGMLGVEFRPDNTVVFKGLDEMFEDSDVINARAFFKDLAEQGQTPLVRLTADLDEFAWDNGFINAIHMGFKPVANDGTLFNPNLVEFGSDVTMQLTTPRISRRPRPAPALDNTHPREVLEEGDTLVEYSRSSEEVVQRELYDQAETRRPYERVEEGDTLVGRPDSLAGSTPVASQIEAAVPNTVAGMLARTDSMVYAVPSPNARVLEEAVEALDNPASDTVSELARRLQSTDSLIVTPAVDASFAELANATQIRKVIDRLRVRAEETKKHAYNLTVQLPMGYRQVVDELSRLNIDTSVSFSGITARTMNRNEVYHGTRVQTPDVAKLDHINGGSPSPIGIGLHVTETEMHAKYHAMRTVNEDLPSDVPRDYGAPSVSRYTVSSDAYVLDASVEYTEVATLVREVLQEVYEPLVDAVPPQLSVKQAIEFVDKELNGEDAMITLFQREFSDGLRAGGVDVIDAGPEARVVLNTEVLIDGTLNAPVHGVQDTAANATRYASYAFKLDDAALKTARSQRDNLEAAYAHAAQEVHEIKNILNEVDDRVHQAISETALWDYNGVPDPDNIPRYKPDPEPELRGVSTPFDTQTADISPCTL